MYFLCELQPHKYTKGMRKRATNYMPNLQEYHNKSILPKLRKGN